MILKNQRGYFLGPAVILVLVVVMSVVLMGRNAAMSNQRYENKLVTFDEDLHASLESVLFALADSRDLQFGTKDLGTSTVPPVDIEVDNYFNVINLDNPNVLMLTDMTDGNKFSLPTASTAYGGDKYEIINNLVYRRIHITIQPSFNDVISNSPQINASGFSLSFPSNKGNSFNLVNIGGNRYSSKETSTLIQGLNKVDELERNEVELNDFKGIQLMYPRKVGEEIVKTTIEFK